MRRPEHERQFVADATKLLTDALAAPASSRPEVGPRELAETLCATYGLKHRVATPIEYRDRMAVALRIALPGDQHGRKGATRAASRRR